MNLIFEKLLKILLKSDKKVEINEIKMKNRRFD